MAVAALTFNGLLAMLTWPGLLVVNAVCARFGIYASGSNNFGLMFAAGFLVDALIYTAIFFAAVTGWRLVAPKVVKKR